MTEKPDAGDLVDQEQVPIGPEDEALTVARRVTEAAVVVLARSWPKLKAGAAPRFPLDLVEGLLLRSRQARGRPHRLFRPAQEVHDLVRAVAPPVARCLHGRFRPPRHDLEDPALRLRRPRHLPEKIELTEKSVIVYCGDYRPVEILLARPRGSRT